MEKRVETLEEQIKLVSKKFLEKTQNKEILVVSHFDTDGITSAAIMIKTLKKLDKTFSVKILKNLEEEFIYDLPKNKIILFLDLASGSFQYISDTKLENVFIIDHHEITCNVPENVLIVNPELHEKEKMSASCLTYLFCKELTPEIKPAAKLAILGMIGDLLEKEVDKLNHGILTDGEVTKKRGLLIYPSTRPLNRALEFSSNPYIPGVTGDSKGVMELLREADLDPSVKGFKSLMELTDEEMQNLITSVMLRNPKAKHNEIIGDIFLIKLFNKLEDARELSAKVNACSRFGESSLAIQLCMEIPDAKKRAETIHAKYKQLLISGLKFAENTQKIKGKGFVIINAKHEIRETMIGTIASILSNSSVYEEGTIITTMAYYENRIKVSSRITGKVGRNLRKLLSKVVEPIGGQVGGHHCAAGCIITQDKEEEFIENLKKNLEIEVVKVKQ
ncbi:MAG: DHH family phosphoesterase [Candidatus Pacearchaeota archaeon]|jgi:RecJ-like exonuclease